jgi:hypothetical protein
MKHALKISAIALFLAAAASAQEAKEISPDFSRAANRALVAIKNSDNTDTEGPDSIVREAINAVDAAAFNEQENAVAKRLKIMAYFRPITLAVYTLTLTNAYSEAELLRSAPCAGHKKKKQECEAAKAQGATQGPPSLPPLAKSKVDKVTADLDKINSCIAATRIAVQNFSGREPKECN